MPRNSELNLSNLNLSYDSLHTSSQAEIYLDKVDKLYDKIKPNDEIKSLEKEVESLKNEVELLEKQSFIDSLTGCYNRNYYEQFKTKNFDAVRDDQKLALIFVDLNNLKLINDNINHEAGDNAIRYTANFLKNNFRPSDIVIRWGGDEFVVICRLCEKMNEEQFLDNLNLESRAPDAIPRGHDYANLEYDNSDNLRPDLAMGVAVYDSLIDESLEATEARADKSMYENKEAQKIASIGRAVLSSSLGESFFVNYKDYAPENISLVTEKALNF